jgi:hypothetical protein
VDFKLDDEFCLEQTEADIAASMRLRGAISVYMHWKLEADKNLVKRDAFKWTILRPGGLTDSPGTGKVSVGRTRVARIPVSFKLNRCVVLDGHMFF